MAVTALYVVVDKGLSPKALSRYVPATFIDAKTKKAPQVYKGHDADEDYAVLDVAFWAHAAVLTADYAMIGKAKKYHKYVEGHAADRCLNGVVVVPSSEMHAKKVLAAFRVGRLRVTMAGFRGEPFAVTWNDISGDNLAVNLRANPPTGAELCNCPWERDDKK